MLGNYHCVTDAIRMRSGSSFIDNMVSKNEKLPLLLLLTSLTNLYQVMPLR